MFDLSKTWKFVLTAILVPAAAWPGFTAMADETVRIEPRENWSAVFGGAEQKLTFDITSDKPLNGRMTWAHSAGQRTISRGEMPVKGKSDTVSVKLRIPPVKEGVVLDTQLTLGVIQDGDREPVASLSKPLWLYAKNPFVDRTEWLEELKITLYDPTDDEKTTDIFDGAEIPYKTVRNVGAFESLEEGMLVVAEGVSLEDHRGLGPAMTAVAARGIHVLCLAPSDGSFSLPGADNDDEAAPMPQRVSYRRQDVVTELDKRLDAEAWPPDGNVISSRLAIKGDRDEVLAEVSESRQAWPWIEIQFPGDGATLLICGFGLIEHWDDGPTPRFLLARIFERLNPPQEKSDMDSK